MFRKNPSASAGSFVAAATAGGIIAQQVAGKAVRDALFLSTFRVVSLPLVMAAAAGLSLLAVLWISRLMARHAPRRALLLLFGTSAAGLALEWLAMPYSRRAAVIAVYLHVAMFGPVLLSAFWSLINEQFDPHTARTAVARVATGGTVGGVLGGLGAWRASTLVSVPTTVLLLACVNLLCLLGTMAIPKRAPDPAPAPSADTSSTPRSALGEILGAPYLRNLATLVAVGAAISSLLDYVFSAQVTAAYGSGAPLLAFFALFGLGVSLLSLVLQVSLGRVAMEKLGVAMNIAVLPGIIILGGAAGLTVPGLVSASLLRGGEMVQRNTLFRSAYELLYTPLEEHQKRATKALIDVGFDRVGTVIGSSLVSAIVALFTQNQAILLGAVVLLALGSLPLARQIHSGYVGALEQRLREGARVLPEDPDAIQRPTAAPLEEEKARDALIANVELAREHHEEPGPAADALARGPELLAAVDAMISMDTARKRRALVDWNASHVPLVPFAILLLAQEDVHADARKALRRVAPDVTGQLLDALLHPGTDFIVRRRIPAVLSVCATQRAADGLLLGLADDRFEVRYACGRALMKVTDREPGIVFVREKVIETIQREIALATTAFSELDDGSEEEADTFVELIARDRASRSVENLFSLLSLILERSGLRLCFSGLHHEDDRQRGTALEYLHTVLPGELRDQLMPLLSGAGFIPTARAPAELLAEMTKMAIDAAFESADALPAKLRQCCGALVTMGAAFARIWTLDAKGEALDLRASAGMYTRIDGTHAHISLGADKIGCIASTREPLLIHRVLGDPRFPEQAWAKREGLVSFAGYPLLADDALVGVVALFAKHDLSGDMLSLLGSAADQIARGLRGPEPAVAPVLPPEA